MMKIFKTVREKGTVLLAKTPDITSHQGMHSQKVRQIAQKKRAPRFLTHKRILKLKQRQSIDSFVALRYRRKTQHQNKATFAAGMLPSIYVKTRYFFNILQHFTNRLMDRNAYLVRKEMPFLYGGLKGASTIAGFKKVLYHTILVQDRRLKPAYNRRKHNPSHYMVVQNQLARLDKTFVYLGKKKLTSMVGLVLKKIFNPVIQGLHWRSITPWLNKTLRRNEVIGKSIRAKAIPLLVSVIEGQVSVLLWRNQLNCSLNKSRQDYRQGALQNLYVISKKNMVVLLL